MNNRVTGGLRGLILASVIAGVLSASAAAPQTGKLIARGAEVYGPVTPLLTKPLREARRAPAWKPGDPIKEIPRYSFLKPGHEPVASGVGDPDPLLEMGRGQQRGGPSITFDVNVSGLPFGGGSPPDTVGDVGPNHYLQSVNASSILVLDKTGVPIAVPARGAVGAGAPTSNPFLLEDLAPSGDCQNGAGDPIILYDWLADRWFLQEFTGANDMCIYISQTPDPLGAYYLYEFTAPNFPDYPHFGVWSDAYYGGTNEGGGAGNQTTYAFDRSSMVAGNPATMQRLAVIPPLSGFGFQLVTPADHDGDTPPPVGAAGIFMRHVDDEAHSVSPSPTTDTLQVWEMSVDWSTPANTTVVQLPDITVTDFNSWFKDYTTFFTVPQPGSATELDPIREAILQRLVYRNFGTHETLLGVLATNRNPATAGDSVEASARWFELRKTSGGGSWTLFDEGTFAGDAPISATEHFFVPSVAMDGMGNIAMGYSTTDTGAAQVFPSIGVTGRLTTDSSGIMTAGENSLPGGSGVGTIPSTGGGGRWGDYASMSIDPADDCTFWFTTEYTPSGTTWDTWVSSFLFEECLFGFSLASTPQSLDVCVPNLGGDPSYDIGVTSNGGWSFAVDLSASGLPPGSSAAFVPDNQLPDFSSTMTVSGLGSAPSGLYQITVTATGSDAPPTVRNKAVQMDLAANQPGALSLSVPANNATGLSLFPVLSWQASSDAATYQVEVATDVLFNNVVEVAGGLTGTSYQLTTALDPSTTYYWRTTASNVCGSVESNIRQFSTVLLVCNNYTSTDVPLAIPPGAPGSTLGTTDSTLVVPAGDDGVVASVRVTSAIGTHTYMGDLDFDLVSPAATVVRLRDRACDMSDDFNTGWADLAVGTPPCPPTDGSLYPPAESLLGFSGEQSSGAWILRIIDNFNQDSGQLDGWSMEICTEFSEQIFADGFESGDTLGWQ